MPVPPRGVDSRVHYKCKPGRYGGVTATGSEIAPLGVYSHRVPTLHPQSLRAPPVIASAPRSLRAPPVIASAPGHCERPRSLRAPPGHCERSVAISSPEGSSLNSTQSPRRCAPRDGKVGTHEGVYCHAGSGPERPALTPAGPLLTLTATRQRHAASAMRGGTVHARPTRTFPTG